MSTQQTTLQVDGMTCSSCVRHVETALRELEGIRAVSVDLQKGKVVVEHDDRPALAAMIEAIVGAGYESRLATVP